MRISPIQPNFITKTKSSSNQNTHQKNSTPKNINFGVANETIILARIFTAVEKNVAKPERIKSNCYYIINKKVKERFPELLKELKVLNSNTDKGIFYKIASTLPILEKTPKKIRDLKLLTLEEVLHTMDDSDTDNRIAKKDFMMSLVDSGEHLNQAFLKQFALMPDKFYGGFKECVVEKSLHSALKNKKLMHKAPDVYLFNLTMLRSIMTPEHQNFFNMNKEDVSQLLKNIETISKWKLTEKQNSAYFNYLENFEKQKNWKTFTSDFFRKELLESGFEKENLMKRLNISEKIANLLLRELQVIACTKTGMSKEQKIEEYKAFIDEILNSDYIGAEYIDRLLYRKKAIEKFINSTDCKEELLNRYKPDLDKLQKTYDYECKVEASYSDNSDNLESWERAELEAPWIIR